METKAFQAIPLCGKEDKNLAFPTIRAKTQSHDDAESIEKVAKTIASSGFLAHLFEAFVPHYRRGQSQFNYWLIAGKSADFILQLFKNIAKNVKKAHAVSITHKVRKKHFASVCATTLSENGWSLQ